MLGYEAEFREYWKDVLPEIFADINDRNTKKALREYGHGFYDEIPDDVRRAVCKLLDQLNEASLRSKRQSVRRAWMKDRDQFFQRIRRANRPFATRIEAGVI